MTRLALIRHASTGWTEQGRLQGRADIPLSPGGRTEATGWRPPCGDAECVSSPLMRARETLQCMGIEEFTIEPRLAEMNWGRWEGNRLADLRDDLGAAMVANEARGLDFRPDGGESPREVQGRIRPWLAEVAARERPVIGVTHKGVIRAVLALATGWDMRAAPPARLHWNCAHLFTLDANGRAAVERLNTPLARP